MEQEITEAVHALKEAIDNVRYQADKSILATVLAKAEAISNELDLYVEEGKEEFLTARKEAQEVYEDPQATQEEVDNASKTLTAAMTALRKIANKGLFKGIDGVTRRQRTQTGSQWRVIRTWSGHAGSTGCFGRQPLLPRAIRPLKPRFAISKPS